MLIQAGADQQHNLAGDEADSYGLHLTLRACDIENRGALGDPAAVEEFLVSLVAAIGMTVLAGPLVGTETGPPELAGVSGVVILVESHAAIHTYPAVGEAFVDAFSCRPFDPGTVATVLRACFGTLRLKETMLTARGRHWRVDIGKELLRWNDSRPGTTAGQPLW